MGKSKVENSKSEDETKTLALKLAKKVKTLPYIYILKGPVGAGKTTWVKGFVQGYLGKDVPVSSPSYSLINGYSKGKKKVIHVDLYRITSEDDLESIGFWDLLEGKQVVVVEWGEIVKSDRWPKNVKGMAIDINIVDENSREIILTGFGRG